MSNRIGLAYLTVGAILIGAVGVATMMTDTRGTATPAWTGNGTAVALVIWLITGSTGLVIGLLLLHRSRRAVLKATPQQPESTDAAHNHAAVG